MCGMNAVPMTETERYVVFQSYGGLRGAIAFCLVALLNVESTPHKKLFQTTVFVVIIFTVFIQVRLSHCFLFTVASWLFCHICVVLQ